MARVIASVFDLEGDENRELDRDLDLFCLFLNLFFFTDLSWDDWTVMVWT